MARFVNIDRETPLLLPYDLNEWIPSEHIVHFILESVELVKNAYNIKRLYNIITKHNTVKA